MIKKLSIGFGTTILTIIAMLFSISSVKALPYIDLNYSSIKTRFETYFYDMEKIINYLEENYSDDYDFVIRSRTKNTSGLTYVEIAPKGRARTYFSATSVSSNTVSIYLSRIGTAYEENRYVSCVIYANDFATSKKNIDTCVSQVATTTLNSPHFDLFNYFTSVGSNYKSNYTGGEYSTLLVYSNNKVYNKNAHGGKVQSQKYDFYLDGTIYTLNDEVPTYWEWQKKFDVPTYTTEIIGEPGKTTFSLNLSNYDTSVFRVVICDESSCYPVETNPYSLEFTENKNLSLSIYEISSNKKVASEEFTIEVEPLTSYTTNLKQVFSIDLLFDTNISNKNFSFKLGSSDYYERISWDSVQYLGLVYENDLYHWEKIEFEPTDSSIMIEDAVEIKENGVYTLNLTNVNFAKKTYQKTMLRLLLNNAINIDSITFQGEMTLNETIFFNDVGYRHIKNKFLLSGNGIKYLNFSTNSEYQETVYFDLLSEEYENKLHLDIFNTSTGKFKEYGIIRPFATVDGRYFANVDASKERNVGFWFTLGDLENHTCEFIYSFPIENIYWSESTSKANEENYISSDGTIKNELTPSDDIVYTNSNLNIILKRLTDFIEKIKTPISFFFKCISYFYNSLNPYIKGLITSLLTLFLMACVYKFVRRWNA